MIRILVVLTKLKRLNVLTKLKLMLLEVLKLQNGYCKSVQSCSDHCSSHFQFTPSFHELYKLKNRPHSNSHPAGILGPDLVATSHRKLTKKEPLSHSAGMSGMAGKIIVGDVGTTLANAYAYFGPSAMYLRLVLSCLHLRTHKLRPRPARRRIQ